MGDSVQFRVSQSCLTLWDPMNCSLPGLPIHHQLPEFTQTQVHRVSDAIQPSHPLSSPSPPAPNPSQHQSLFQWVNSSHQVAKVLEFQWGMERSYNLVLFVPSNHAFYICCLEKAEITMWQLSCPSRVEWIIEYISMHVYHCYFVDYDL